MARSTASLVLLCLFAAAPSASSSRVDTSQSTENKRTCSIKSSVFNFSWHFETDGCLRCSGFNAYERMKKDLFEHVVCPSSDEADASKVCKALTKAKKAKRAAAGICGCSLRSHPDVFAFGYYRSRSSCDDETCFLKFADQQNRRLYYKMSFGPDAFEDPRGLCNACVDADADASAALGCTDVELTISGAVASVQADHTPAVKRQESEDVIEVDPKDLKDDADADEELELPEDWEDQMQDDDVEESNDASDAALPTEDGEEVVVEKPVTESVAEKKGGQEPYESESDSKSPNLSVGVDLDEDDTDADAEPVKRPQGYEKFLGELDDSDKKTPGLSVVVGSNEDYMGSDEEPVQTPEGAEKFLGEHDEESESDTKSPGLSVDVESHEDQDTEEVEAENKKKTAAAAGAEELVVAKKSGWEEVIAELSELQESFKVSDKDGEGFISEAELAESLQGSEMEGDDDHEIISEGDVGWMLKAADKDNDGKLSFREYVALMAPGDEALIDELEASDRWQNLPAAEPAAE